jgi:hypothetical protein
MVVIRILIALVILAATVVGARVVAKLPRYRRKPGGPILTSLIGAVGTILIILVNLGYTFRSSAGTVFIGLAGGYALGYIGQPFLPFFLIGVAVCSAYAALFAALSLDWAGVGICLLTLTLLVLVREYLMRRQQENQDEDTLSA